MDIFASMVFLVGRVRPSGVDLLGTAFLVRPDGLFVTSRHVVGDDMSGIVLIPSKVKVMDDYQDVDDRDCQTIDVQVVEINPLADLVILKAQGTAPNAIELGSLDDVQVGEFVEIFGYPHCVDGRMVLTYQSAIIGAKVLLDSSGVKIKHAVVNFQTRPGQSGSLIFSKRTGKVVGLLSGTYLPQRGSWATLGGINPAELNQTSHIVSAEYIREMIL